jgi:hypothetical protein
MYLWIIYIENLKYYVMRNFILLFCVWGSHRNVHEEFAPVEYNAF